MASRKSSRKDLPWLKPMWERKKQQTASRVDRAVKHLVKAKQPVTLDAIRATVRALFDVSISTNTIQRNEEAYAVYLQHRTSTPRLKPKDAALGKIIAAAQSSRTASLRARINRLRRETKDALIARVMELEQDLKRRIQCEDTLREEILRLTLHPRRKEVE
jgi:hypothetical protein